MKTKKITKKDMLKRCKITIKKYNKLIKSMDKYLEFYNTCKSTPKNRKSIKNKIKEIEKTKQQLIKSKYKYDIKISRLSV